MKTLVLSMISIAATVAAMTACTSESSEIDNVIDDAKVEIKATAGIGSITAKAAVIPGQALSDIVFVRTDGEAKPTWATATVTSIDASMEATSGKITFTPSQYYPTTSNAYFVGYYPKTKGTLTSGVVTYSGLNGQDDIMYGTEMSGAKASASTLSTNFAHKLTQIKFKVVAKDATAASVWGSVTSIKLVKQSNSATLSLSDGTVAFTGTKDKSFDIFSGTQDLTTTVSTEPIGSVLAEAAVTDGYSIEIKTTTLSGGIEIKLDKVGGVASTSYITTITFSGTNIDATGAIDPWTEDTSGTGTVE